MKISTVKKDIQTVKAKLTKVEQFTTSKNGQELQILVLYTDKGNFSNHVSVWKKQHIDIEKLKEGEELSIDYTMHTAANGVQFKNFVKVRHVSDW